MVDQDYKRAREAAAKELEKLLAVQQQTEQRILHLRNTIAALDALSDSFPKRPGERLSLMEAIRSVFKAAAPNERFTARDIRSALLGMGFQDSDYSNFLASIHVILRRLTGKGELTPHLSSKGTTFQKKEVVNYLAEL